MQRMSAPQIMLCLAVLDGNSADKLVVTTNRCVSSWQTGHARLFAFSLAVMKEKFVRCYAENKRPLL
jgi:hypothetical protein